MPALQSVLSDLNHAFGREQISALVKRRGEFAQGKSLDAAIVVKRGTPLYRAWKSYLLKIPGSFQESIRSIIYYALSTTPATPIKFAWAPGYDFELNVWHAP